MAQRKGWAAFTPLKGQNTTDNPLSLGDGWATATRNISLDPDGYVASKRAGSRTITVPTNTILLASHQASATSSPELWAFVGSGANPMWRSVGGAAFAQINPSPSITVQRALSFNGKLFLAAGTAGVNRMYVWDGTQVRFVGLSVSAAPTVANTGGGAYAAVLRYYKVDWVTIDAAGRVAARSELSPSVSFTPSGAGAAARVTKPATLEHATHWRVWGSTDNVLFRKLSADIVVATTTYDDSVLPSAYTGDLPEAVGTFLPPPSVTRVKNPGNRLMICGLGTTATAAGTGETAPRSQRIWYTPVLGSLDQGDDERIPQTADQKNYLDLGQAPSGDLSEIDGPMDGQMFAFGLDRPWRLPPTGDVTTPFLAFPIQNATGAGDRFNLISSNPGATAMGETEGGQPAIYWTDSQGGVYRVTGANDVHYVSYDLEGEIAALRAAGRLAITGIPRAVFSDFTLKRTWWLVPLTAPNELRIYVFHWRNGRLEGVVVKGGWTTWVHAVIPSATSVLAYYQDPANFLTINGAVQIPHVVGPSDTVAYVYDQATVAKDGATAYAASIDYAPIVPVDQESRATLLNPVLTATALVGKQLRVTATRDFGTQVNTVDVPIGPTRGEPVVIRTAEGLFQGDVTEVAISVGDAAADSAVWRVHDLRVPFRKQESR